ncbi:MAG: tRNA-dihydrouridine synthase family protein [Phycisphaerae bacterium]
MLAIGPHAFAAPFVQAALSGYSDAPMRRLARQHGCPYALNEVVLDRLVLLGGKAMRRSLRLDADDHPVGGQLMGSEPDQFAAAAAVLVEAGYDVVDINFGCPVKKVLGRCRGGFLLATPAAAVEIVRRVVDSVAGRVPVTLKMRRGMDDSPESERSFFSIFDAAWELGVAAITVHGRTVRQRYVGPSNWEFLARVKRHAGSRTVIGSGDAFSAEDCVRMIAETGVDGVSVARGAIGNPFIFREAAELHAGRPLPEPPAIAAQRAAIARHFELATAAYGADRAAVLLRKFGVRYSELHPQPRDVKMAFLAVRNAAEFQAMLNCWYDPAADWPPVVRRARPEALIAAGATWDCGAG